MSERYAPEGYIWQCRKCGKRAYDLYGLDGEKSYGWDISCVMGAELVALGPSENCKTDCKTEP